MKLIQHFSGCLLVLSLSACSSFWGIGESNLSCDAEKGMGCTGIRAAYMATDSYSPEVDARNHWVRKSQSSDSYSRGKASEYGYQSGTVADFMPADHRHIIPTVAGAGEITRPLRQPEQVMRVWVNTHQDEEGNLVYPSHIYTQAKEPQWAIGQPASRRKSSKVILPPKSEVVEVAPSNSGVQEALDELDNGNQQAQETPQAPLAQ